MSEPIWGTPPILRKPPAPGPDPAVERELGSPAFWRPDGDWELVPPPGYDGPADAPDFSGFTMGNLLLILDLTERLAVTRIENDPEETLERHEFEVLTPDRSKVLAKLEKRPSRANQFLGALAPVPYVLTEQYGSPVVVDIVRSGRRDGPPRLDLFVPGGLEATGSIRLETPPKPARTAKTGNPQEPPRFAIITPDQRRLTLTGEDWNAEEYRIHDAAGQVRVRVERPGNGYLTRLFTYDITFTAGLAANDRLLGLVAVMFLDQLAGRFSG